MGLEEVSLSIIIVNWNSWEDLDRCLRSIKKYARDISLETIVVDNNSSQPGYEQAAKNHPEVRIIILPENVGFPVANNIGFETAKGEFLLALNPDTEIYENTLQHSMAFLNEHPDYGCVGVKTLKSNGKIQLACARQFITLKRAVIYPLLLDKIFPKIKFLQSIEMAFWDHTDDRDVDMIQGAYMMFPRKVYETVGGLDERLPMFLEDCEFCIRLWKNGYKIRYLSTVYITHYIAQSTKKASTRWITDMRYDAFYHAIEEYEGKRKARLYPLIMMVALPINVIISPFLALGIYIKHGNNRFPTIFSEALLGIFWAINKLQGRRHENTCDRG